jgi:Methyltransferase domain
VRRPILREMRRIDGWLSDHEADLLIAATVKALTTLDPPHEIVEVGSYCGRATVVLARAAMALRDDARVYAVDPHDGRVRALGGRLQHVAPSREYFAATIRSAGVADRVITFVDPADETDWDGSIALLVIDHFHDYASISRRFRHFEPWLVKRRRSPSRGAGPATLPRSAQAAPARGRRAGGQYRRGGGAVGPCQPIRGERRRASTAAPTRPRAT